MNTNSALLQVPLFWPLWPSDTPIVQVFGGLGNWNPARVGPNVDLDLLGIRKLVVLDW
jgi:hypothetical protein